MAATHHVVLGLRLEPLSLGHVFTLADSSSPFLKGGAAALIDLSDAVFVCSQPWRQAARDSRKWWFPIFCRIWSRKCKAMDFDQEAENFKAYIDAETNFPLAKQDRINQKEFGSPWQWRLLAILMSDFHQTKEQALDMAVQEAALLFAAKGEVDGTMKLWTKSDQDFDDWCREQDQSREGESWRS